MPKDVYYFKHDSNAATDLKIKAMRKHYGWEGYGWYWFLIETLRNEDNYCLEYSEFTFDSLSEDMKCDCDKVKQFIDDCIEKFKLFENNGSHFFSGRLLRDMKTYEEYREQQREAGIKGAMVRYGNPMATLEQPHNDPIAIKGNNIKGEKGVWGKGYRLSPFI